MAILQTQRLYGKDSETQMEQIKAGLNKNNTDKTEDYKSSIWGMKPSIKKNPKTTKKKSRGNGCVSHKGRTLSRPLQVLVPSSENSFPAGYAKKVF